VVVGKNILLRSYVPSSAHRFVFAFPGAACTIRPLRQVRATPRHRQRSRAARCRPRAAPARRQLALAQKAPSHCDAPSVPASSIISTLRASSRSRPLSSSANNFATVRASMAASSPSVHAASPATAAPVTRNPASSYAAATSRCKRDLPAPAMPVTIARSARRRAARRRPVAAGRAPRRARVTPPPGGAQQASPLPRTPPAPRGRPARANTHRDRAPATRRRRLRRALHERLVTAAHAERRAHLALDVTGAPHRPRLSGVIPTFVVRRRNRQGIWSESLRR